MLYCGEEFATKYSLDWPKEKMHGRKDERNLNKDEMEYLDEDKEETYGKITIEVPS